MRTAACVMAGILVTVVVVIGPVLADGKVPTIKEIMDKLHKGANPPIILIKRNLQSSDPDWEEIQKQTKEFMEMVEALEKNDPPKGDKGSWVRLARQYISNAKAMNAAAQNNDKRETLKFQAKLAGSCTTCHKAHRPE